MQSGVLQRNKTACEGEPWYSAYESHTSMWPSRDIGTDYFLTLLAITKDLSSI